VSNRQSIFTFSATFEPATFAIPITDQSTRYSVHTHDYQTVYMRLH